MTSEAQNSGSGQDSYSEFLDLPPGVRPPHYYDLLELELFCSHYERIHHAVRKQFRLIKPFQSHSDRATREAVQDVMCQIAGARVVLTDPRKKDAYDRELAERLGIDRNRYLAGQMASPLPEWEIVVIAGPTMLNERVQLVEGSTVTLGSDSHCSLPLRSARVEARHCTMTFADGDWSVRAVHPRAKFLVNGEVSLEDRLHEGDTLEFGGYRFKVVRTGPKAGSVSLAEKGAKLPPPLSLMVRRGLSIPMPTFNVLPPQRVIIGSAESALWQLSDRTVSGHHCAIQSMGDRWEIEDLRSTNHTLVNGTEVLRHMLNDRDVIGVGEFDVLVSLRF